MHLKIFLILLSSLFLLTAFADEAAAQKAYSAGREQEKQGKRLETLESRDGEMWRKAVGYVLTAILGIVIGFVFTQIGF